jgi:hypothetical protein
LKVCEISTSRGSRSAPIGTPPRMTFILRYQRCGRLRWGPISVLIHTRLSRLLRVEPVGYRRRGPRYDAALPELLSWEFWVEDRAIEVFGKGEGE